MTRDHPRPGRGRSAPGPSRARPAALALVAVLVAPGCGDDPQTAAPAVPTVDLDRLDAAARSASPGGEPRTGEYWMQWSTCGEGTQAEVAAANGGRAAGWILLDDLLEAPGMTLGGEAVSTCEAAVAVLARSGSEPDAPLAAELLTAQLNLAAGSATCDVADEAIVASEAVLTSGPPDGAPNLLSDLAQILGSYNRGELCRR